MNSRQGQEIVAKVGMSALPTANVAENSCLPIVFRHRGNKGISLLNGRVEIFDE